MKQRIITGIIAGGLFIGFVALGNLYLFLLVLFMATVGLYELLRMKKIAPLSSLGIVSFLGLWTILSPLETAYPEKETLLLYVLLALVVTVISKNKYTFDHVGFVMLSAVYVGAGFHYFLMTRAHENGLLLVFFVLFTVWASDSGAYFTGRKFGKHKLAKHISPNKTIEGALGGIVWSIVVAVLFQLISPMFDSLIFVVIVAMIISIAGQMGDLVQSAFKRHYDVKDSGKLLPGHGGILDRCDSWLFVFPILHLLQLI